MIKEIKNLFDFYKIPFKEVVKIDNYVHYDGAEQERISVIVKEEADMGFARSTINKSLRVDVAGETLTSFIVFSNEILHVKEIK